jgi:hypothetical protein
MGIEFRCSPPAHTGGPLSRSSEGYQPVVRSCAASRPEPIAEGIWAARAAFLHAPDARFVAHALHF